MCAATAALFLVNCATDGVEVAGGTRADATAIASDAAIAPQPAADVAGDGGDGQRGSVDVVQRRDQTDPCVGDAAHQLCDDGLSCTKDLCVPSYGCMHEFLSGLPCDDGSPCTLVSVCKATIGCAADLKAPLCDDGNACTTETCAQNTCIAGAPQNCADNDPCTDDACDPKTGCTHQQWDCDDGNPWTADGCKYEKSYADGYTSSVCMSESIKISLGVQYAYAKDFPKQGGNSATVRIKNLPSPPVYAEYWEAPYPFLLASFCKDWLQDKQGVDANPLFSAGYMTAGPATYVNVGGHALSAVLFVEKTNFMSAAFEDLTLLIPQSGTLKYDAGGKPIPQDAVASPLLRKLCKDLIALEKK